MGHGCFQSQLVTRPERFLSVHKSPVNRREEEEEEEEEEVDDDDDEKRRRNDTIMANNVKETPQYHIGLCHMLRV